MPKSTRQRAHPQGTNARNRVVHGPTRIARDAAPDLSRRAQVRLEMLDWHERHGANLSRTARHFGYSRPTVYRWLGRYDRSRLETLEDRPSRPVRRRRPTLPPRSPKLHGAVERADRTHTEEFYEVTGAEPTLAAFQAELRVWETVYNTIRPHQALGYLTPAEFLASVGVDV